MLILRLLIFLFAFIDVRFALVLLLYYVYQRKTFVAPISSLQSGVRVFSMVNFQFVSLFTVLLYCFVVAVFIALPAFLLLQQAGSLQEFARMLLGVFKFLATLPVMLQTIVDTLSGVLTEVQKSNQLLKSIDDELDDVSRKLSTISGVVDALEASVDLIEANVALLTPEVTKIGVSTTLISNLLIDYLQPIAAWEPYIISIDKKVGSLDAGVADISVDTTAIEASLHLVVADVSAIAASTAAIDGLVGSIDGYLAPAMAVVTGSLSVFIADYLDPLVKIGWFRINPTAGATFEVRNSAADPIWIAAICDRPVCVEGIVGVHNDGGDLTVHITNVEPLPVAGEVVITAVNAIVKVEQIEEVAVTFKTPVLVLQQAPVEIAQPIQTILVENLVTCFRNCGGFYTPTQEEVDDFFLAAPTPYSIAVNTKPDAVPMIVHAEDGTLYVNTEGQFLYLTTQIGFIIPTHWNNGVYTSSVLNMTFWYSNRVVFSMDNTWAVSVQTGDVLDVQASLPLMYSQVMDLIVTLRYSRKKF